MSIPYELAGRTQQKRRTKEALVGAARALVAQGLTPTVEAAAEAADISRTTAYRYFTNQRALLAAAHPETEVTSLLPADATDDPEQRLDTVLQAFHRLVLDTEEQQRTMLRLSLEPSADRDHRLPLRQGRAIGWIEDALAPASSLLSPSELHELAVAIRSATGIEAFVWLNDVAGLAREEAFALTRRNARVLLRAALADAAS
jgi:AcrR family transcriptional regulator